MRGPNFLYLRPGTTLIGFLEVSRSWGVTPPTCAPGMDVWLLGDDQPPSPSPRLHLPLLCGSGGIAGLSRGHSCGLVVNPQDFLEEEPGPEATVAAVSRLWRRPASSGGRLLRGLRPGPRCPCGPAAGVTLLASGSLSQLWVPGAVKFLLCLNLLELVSDT